MSGCIFWFGALLLIAAVGSFSPALGVVVLLFFAFTRPRSN